VTDSRTRLAVLMQGIVLCFLAGCGPVPRSTTTTAQPRRQLDAEVYRFKEQARDTLSRLPSSPPTCDRGYHELRGYVIATSDWAQTAGLQRGDRVEKSDLRREGAVVTVQRDGHQLAISFACKDGSALWGAVKNLLTAVTKEDWGDCIRQSIELSRVARRETSTELRVRYSCLRFKTLTEGRRFADASAATLLYNVNRLALEESRYVPGQTDRIRGEVLVDAEELRKIGFATLASDLEEKIRAPREDPASRRAPQPYAAPPTVTRGTGFAVRPDGLILTAPHVVEGATTISVKCPDRPVALAVVVQATRNLDLATLGTPLVGLPYLSFVEARALRAGEPVFTIGFPAPEILGSEPKFTDGSVSALSGPGGEASFLQITVPVQPGNSGGALLNNSGHAVGIVTSSAAIVPFLTMTGTLPQNVNWAVKAVFATPLFDPPQAIPATRDRDEAIDRAKKATCFVEGRK
jgi:S1-C subfamily serine protease